VQRIQIIDETLLVPNGNSIFSKQDEFRMRNNELLSVSRPNCKRPKPAAAQSLLQFLHIHRVKFALRLKCRQGRLDVRGVVQLNGTGPKGRTTGTLQSGTTAFINGFGTATSLFSEEGIYDFKVHVAKTWTVLAVYKPTLSQPQDFGVTSTSTAYGSIQLISATK
jgi:hypothetical protein